ncbi:MAG: 4Fe-4S binding protein [Anaerolineae bacterium]|nr:4Fe-4S binding protein [Anaerolineae bacterium]
MQKLTYILINVAETLLRMLPLSCKTGVIRIGRPGRDAPVFLTCNYHLTVERVKRALRGLDCYLLVANSRGVNVWCAAAGGLFTDHDVISALKTSGIEDLVDQREVILPQLAAAGIETRIVREKTGWQTIWGPVYAQDIPAFLADQQQKTAEMRQVRFPLSDRIEMSVAWAFPISVIAALVLLVFWRTAILPLVLLVWGISLLVFIAFPLYARWLNVKRERVRSAAFDFGRGGIQLILWGLCLLVLAVLALRLNSFGWGDVLHWGLITLVVVLVVSIDLSGSTPVLKSGLHPDRLFQVSLDREKCIACGICERVCPRNCFQIDHQQHIETMPGAARCVQCGACIVQCPVDALSLHGPKGEVVLPEMIRKFKLNLMGSRATRDV